MHNQLFPLLNAYLDGELHGTRLRDMERHLADCEICQQELDELRRVSDLVRAAPLPAFTSADRFASNLTLLLPRRPQQFQSQRLPSFGWWVVPAGLLGIWFFLQTVFTLTDIIQVANLSGLVGQIIPWLPEGTSQTAWFAVTSSLFGLQLNAGQQSTLSMLNNVSIFGVDLLQSLFWQAGLILLCLAWFASWKVWGQSTPIRIESNP